MTSESEEKRDQTLIALRGLVERNPEAAQAAGGRLSDRASRALAEHEAEHRADAEARRAAVALARDVALGTVEMPPPPTKEGADPAAYAKATYEYGRLGGYIHLFQSLPDALPELAELDPVAAYVKAWGLNGVRYAASHPNPDALPKGASDAAYWEASARHELGLGERPELMGLFLGQEVARIADEPRQRLRRDHDWWEVCAATLLAEDPETSTATLGMGAELRCGEWYRSGEGTLFDHREGIRAYAGADPEQALRRDVERRDRLWALASRAVRFLRDSEQRTARRGGIEEPARERDPAPSPDVERLLADAQRLQSERVAAADAKERRRKAFLALQVCAQFAQPGETARWEDPTDQDSELLLLERFGRNEQWPQGNEEFCEAWVRRCWEPSRADVLAAFGADAVEASTVEPGQEHPSDVRDHLRVTFDLAKALYVKFLQDGDVEGAIDSLARVRAGLGAGRYQLGLWFPHLAGRLRRPAPPEPQPSTDAIAPDQRHAGSTASSAGQPGCGDIDDPDDHAGLVYEFRRYGLGWKIKGGGKDLDVHDSRGIQYIHALLGRPGVMIDAAELDGHRVQAETSFQEVLDEPGLKLLHEKVVALQEEIEVARVHESVDKQERLETERQAIIDQVARATNHRGRGRSFSTESRKVNQRVGRAITRAIERLKDRDPVLHEHLLKCIREPGGGTPAYIPNGSPRITWVLR